MGKDKEPQTLELKVNMSSQDDAYCVAKVIQGMKGLELVSADVANKKVTVKGKDIKQDELLRKLSMMFNQNVQVIPKKTETPTPTPTPPPKPPIKHCHHHQAPAAPTLPYYQQHHHGCHCCHPSNVIVVRPYFSQDNPNECSIM